MNEYHKISEGILGEETIEKTNTELFLSLVGHYFPEAIKDGEVDFTALKEEMGEFHEVGSEHYDFTWAGKQSAKKEAQSDIFGRTLKYKPQDSLNPDTTENIYIEGDNLEALKLLRRNYHGKIKMIYIDPPYNTGKDLIYSDDFAMTDEELSKLSGDIKDNVRLRKNPKDDAKYHTKWLNLMYPRLKVAKDLLADDGVIFISIDDDEVENLKKLCNDIFKKPNYAATFLWTKTSTPPSLSYKSRKTVEYVLAYEKRASTFKFYGEELDGGDAPLLNSGNPVKTLCFPSGSIRFNFIEDGLIKAGEKEKVKLLDDCIVENGVNKNVVRLSGEFKWQQSTLDEEIINGTYFIIKSNKFSIRFQRVGCEGSYKTPNNYMAIELNQSVDVGTNETAVKELAGFDMENCFDYTKPVSLIEKLIKMKCKDCKDAIILDFFCGSGTTAEAVMKLNAEDSGKRKFIMIQLPENLDESLETADVKSKVTIQNAIHFLDGLSFPHKLTEISKERIRRAAKKIHEDNPDAKFDDGFKVFKVADTNIRWNTTDDEEIISLADNDYSTGDKDNIDFTPGHNDIDIVYEIMLRQFDIPLSTPIEKLPEVSDRTYIFANAVVVCLEPEIDEKLIEKLASIEPVPGKFVLRDSAFNDDIELKDVSYRRLSALISNHQLEGERKNSRNNYTVEFI